MSSNYKDRAKGNTTLRLQLQNKIYKKAYSADTAWTGREVGLSLAVSRFAARRRPQSQPTSSPRALALPTNLPTATLQASKETYLLSHNQFHSVKLRISSKTAIIHQWLGSATSHLAWRRN